MPNRSFWIEAKESLEQNSKTAPTSVKILGIGILFVSFLILSIGLIIGLKFPDFVEERIIEEQCIVSTENSHYNKWEFDEQWIRYEKLFFWSTTNYLDVLGSGAAQSLEQKGPYIYRKTATKTDILFSNGLVSYKYIVTFDYDEEKTKAECGQNCSEGDKIVLINKEQIKEFANSKNADDYFLGTIPDWISSKLEDLSARQINVTEHIFSLLGSLDDSFLTNQHDAVVQVLQDISFGSWIGQNDTDYKREVNKLRNNVDFTVQEMSQLYDTLSSKNLMGLPQTADQIQTCRDFVNSNTCLNKYLYHNGTSFGPEYSFDNEFGLNYSNFRNICGLFLLFQTLNDTNLNCFVNSSEWVSELLCLNNDTDCKQFFSNNIYSKNILFSLKQFVFEFLYENSRTFSVNNTKERFFVNKNVKQLAIGYESAAGYVHGILTKNMSRERSDYFGLYVKFSTCLLGRQSSNNMILYQYQTLDTTISTQNGPLYTYFIPPLVDFKTCDYHRPSRDIFYHFSEEYACSIMFKQPREIDYSGIDLFRYTPDLTECSRNNFLCCNHAINYQENSFSGSFVDIEPLSGKVWRKIIRHQQTFDLTNVGRIVDVVLNISAKTFPVFLRESSIEISSFGVAKFKSRMKKMMDASCVGMITLTMIACFVFVFAICILVWPQKTKVHPFILEQSHNLGNSRV